MKLVILIIKRRVSAVRVVHAIRRGACIGNLGTTPLGAHIEPPQGTLDGTNNSALECSKPALGRCMFASRDRWVKHTLPMWPTGRSTQLTLPFTQNLSAVRMLGGLATLSRANGRSVPLPQWDLVYRDPRTNALVNNWTRMDATLDAFVANGIIPSPIVLDNVPYAFVREENRFYGGFG